jgi:hypothetical protein
LPEDVVSDDDVIDDDDDDVDDVSAKVEGDDVTEDVNDDVTEVDVTAGDEVGDLLCKKWLGEDDDDDEEEAAVLLLSGWSLASRGCWRLEEDFNKTPQQS